MGLQLYKHKRNFTQTPEPEGKKASRKGALSFVVQRHDASHLHYDFRLEMDGVLKSWAVPKGPSMKAGERRLAVMVEDHPLQYGKFYGEIPKGNYGAGQVDIWDEGTYEPLEKTSASSAENALLTQLKKGDLKFTMHGHYLNGAFALVRMHGEQEKNWLLIKKKDEHNSPSFNIEKVKPIKLAPEHQNGHGEKPKSSKAAVKKSAKVRAAKKEEYKKAKEEQTKEFKLSLEKAWPTIHKPMLASLTNKVTDDPAWMYEPKYDGYRALSKIANGKVEMFSRNGNSFTKQFASLVAELKKIKRSVVLDGEAVIENSKGISDFQLLQNHFRTGEGTLKYYVFDVLFFEGYTITSMPLEQRRELLEAFFKKYKFTHIHLSPCVREKGTQLFKKYAAKGFEGIIAKNLSSPYLPGKRTDAWLKIKSVREQEAVICGYTQPQNSRQYFGSLMLGLYEDDQLVYIGNCGTGFTDASLKELHAKFSKLKSAKSPFDTTIKGLRGKPTWLKPKLVCNVKFQEWTKEGIMRIPVFSGLRIDKKAQEVVREEKVPGKKTKAVRKTVSTSKAKPVIKKTTASHKAASKETDKEKTLKIGGKEVKCTNLQKVYWPSQGYTKGDLVDYYNRISKLILPYLKDRPQSLNRHPNGIKAPGFYQKDMDVKQLPSWAKTVKIYSKHNKGYIDYLLCNDAATLVYMANLGCIEINPWHSRYKTPDKPDYMMLDLDPGNIAFVNVVNAALVIKEICDEIKISCYCKTSGATGLHIYIPLGAQYTYDEVKMFAEWIARVTHERLPDTTSIERMVSKRKDKVYLDFLQNNKGQTIASAYSVRPREFATVSTPLEWKEVKHGLDPTQFTMFNIEKRVRQKGDLWKGILGKPINLQKVLKEIEKS